MITLAWPGLKEYCQITYNQIRYWHTSVDWYTRTGLQPPFDEGGTLMAVIEKKAREEIFPEYLDKIRANGQDIELFDL